MFSKLLWFTKNMYLYIIGEWLCAFPKLAFANTFNNLPFWKTAHILKTGHKNQFLHRLTNH